MMTLRHTTPLSAPCTTRLFVDARLGFTFVLVLPHQAKEFSSKHGGLETVAEDGPAKAASVQGSSVEGDSVDSGNVGAAASWADAEAFMPVLAELSSLSGAFYAPVRCSAVP